MSSRSERGRAVIVGMSARIVTPNSPVSDFLDGFYGGQAEGIVESDLPERCEECGKTLSPIQAEDSYYATFEVGEDGLILCKKHLDREMNR